MTFQYLFNKTCCKLKNNEICLNYIDLENVGNMLVFINEIAVIAVTII